MRCTQNFGLTETARKFISENIRIDSFEQPCTCGKGTVYVTVRNERVYDEVTGREAGMFDDGPDLWSYRLKDGREVQERIQAVMHSSGPCIFLTLVDAETGRRIPGVSWSKKEIENA